MAQVVRYLVECGADANQQIPGIKYTALFLASANGHVATAQLLVEGGGADVGLASSNGTTPLIVASSRGRAAVVRCLLKHQPSTTAATTTPRGIDVQVPRPPFPTHPRQSMLRSSRPIWYSSGKPVAFLLWPGVVYDLSLEPHLLSLLMAVQDEDGETALWRACYQGHGVIVQVLLEAGADPGIR